MATMLCVLKIQELAWVYCPGHAGVRRNEMSESLASKAPITETLAKGRTDVL